MMNAITLAMAINKLSQLNIKTLTGLPLSKDDEYLAKLANQIADDPPLVEEQEIRPLSPSQEVLVPPPNFKETGSNGNYHTYSDGRFKIRRYNNTKFRGHLSRILIETKDFGRYDALKLRLDEGVGPFPMNASFDDVLNWVIEVARYLDITIIFWSSNLEVPYNIKNGDDRLKCPVYYHDNQFYHLISVKY